MRRNPEFGILFARYKDVNFIYIYRRKTGTLECSRYNRGLVISEFRCIIIPKKKAKFNQSSTMSYILCSRKNNNNNNNKAKKKSCVSGNMPKNIRVGRSVFFFF